MSAASAERCSDLSLAAAESLIATASTTERWLLVEVSGPWPRDVLDPGPLPERAHAALVAWARLRPRSRVLYLRRPGSGAERTGPRVFAVESGEQLAAVRRIPVESHDELADLDLDLDGTPVETALVLVCGHGARDRCCALRGTPVFDALRSRVPEDTLWISSHQGGHRFAGNVVVLPAGIQLGRLDDRGAASVVEDALAGRIRLTHYRGRTCYEAPVQAAEHALRTARQLEAVDDLSLAEHDASVVRFRDRAGALHSVAVTEAAGPEVPASCGAAPESQRAFRTRVL